MGPGGRTAATAAPTAAPRRPGAGAGARAAFGALALLAALAGCAPAPAAVLEIEGCGGGPAVRTSDELRAALASAEPGDTILLAPGTYEGRFVADRPGTPEAPITLCGTAESVLDGGGTDGGYVLHLDGASFWVLSGFAVRNGKKGIMLDATSGAELRDLTVSEIGDEAVHLRRHSSGNLVRGLRIRGTGLENPRFGEGIYVGSAEGNWCELTGCAPDASDGNRILDNVIERTTAEAIDVKEGTTGGLVAGNRVDGSAVTEADALVDVKGNAWRVRDNEGTAAPRAGVQVHVLVPGWGRDNALAGNTVAVPPSGWAIEPVGEAAGASAGNVVACDNVALVDGSPAASRIAPGGCAQGAG